MQILGRPLQSVRIDLFQLDVTNQQIAFTLQLKMAEAFQAFLKQVKTTF